MTFWGVSMVKIVEIKHTKGGQPKSYDVASSNVTIQINNDAEVRLPAGKGEIASMERKGTISSCTMQTVRPFASRIILIALIQMDCRN